MARYIDVEGYRKLFDEEYKKTRELIYQGETHLDNLAEGFSEAGRVIDRMPTADVVPKSEVEQLKRNLEQCENGYRQQIHLLQCKLTDEKSKVREIFEEIEEMLNLQAKIVCKTRDKYRETDEPMLSFIATLDGRIYSLRVVEEHIAELKKKYTESEDKV